MIARPELIDVDLVARTFCGDAEAMPAHVAEWILGMRLPSEDQAQLTELGEKARRGGLSPEEELKIDGYLRAGHLLAIMQSKARQALGKPLSAD